MVHDNHITSLNHDYILTNLEKKLNTNYLFYPNDENLYIVTNLYVDK